MVTSMLGARRLPSVLVVVAAVALGACSSGEGTTTRADEPDAAASSSTSAPAGEGVESELYSQDANWLCRPDLATDVCRDDLSMSTLEPDGTATPADLEVATDPPLDCFYVYPTINFSGEGDNDMDMSDTGAEQVVVDLQAAPFSSVCNVYAPVYRQVFLDALRESGDAVDLAYGDVVDSFEYYMANWNDGRPVVLIGHSQGSLLLTRLIQEEFEQDQALLDQLELALLIGAWVEVPEDADTGGTFTTVPLCRSATDASCVIAYNSVAADDPAPGIWGQTSSPDMVRACTNPAALETGGPSPLQSIMGTAGETFSTAAGAVAVPTFYVHLDGLVTGQCTATAEGTVFAISASPDDAADVRDVAHLLTPLGVGGLHTKDMNLAMGDLLALVGAHADAAAG